MVENDITTIQLSRKTVKHIEKLKVHPRETYEDVLVRVLPKEKVTEIFVNQSPPKKEAKR